MHTQQMIATHPHVRGNVNDTLTHAIEAAFDCAQACTACADACLGEADVAELTQCIRFNLDCADLCAAAGAVASRRTGSNESVMKRLLETCAEACRLCGGECERHAGRMEHCRVCADACGACERLCREAADSITPRLQ
jgi:hypothetical protein